MRKCVRRPYSGPGTQSSVSWLAAQSPFYQPWCPHCTGSRVFTHDERRNSWVHCGHLQGQRALLPHEEEQGAFLSLQPWMGWWPARTFTVTARATSVCVRQGCSSTWSNWNSLEWTLRSPTSTKCGHLSSSLFICKKKSMILTGWPWRWNETTHVGRLLCTWSKL